MYVALLLRWRLPGTNVSCNGTLRCQVTELPYLSGPLSRSAAVGGIAFAAVRRRAAGRGSTVLVALAYRVPN